MSHHQMTTLLYFQWFCMHETTLFSFCFCCLDVWNIYNVYGESLVDGKLEGSPSISSMLPVVLIIVTLIIFGSVFYSQSTGTENNTCAKQYWKQRDDGALYAHSSS